jgi:DNA-directed RNA polymerase subunit RPC12/RpoP
MPPFGQGKKQTGAAVERVPESAGGGVGRWGTLKSMTEVTCSQCGTRYRVRPEFAGLRFRCKNCGARFVAPGHRAKVDDLPQWMRLRDIDPGMIADTVDLLRRQNKPQKSTRAKPLSAEEQRWQSLIAEMYGQASPPQR